MERLTAVDTAWFRMEEAQNPVDIVAVFVFAGALDHARFHEVAARLVRSRRFRQRVRWRPVGRPQWVDDGAFCLDDHLHFHELERPQNREALEAAVSRLTSRQFDLSRPLWELHVLDGYEGTRSVLVARLHHAMGDGLSLMSLVLAMADGAPELARAADGAREPRRERAPFEHALRRAWRRRREWVHNARASAQSLARLVFLSFDSPTELRGAVSGRRLCAWSGPIPLRRVKEVGRSMGATVNDVMLTVLAGALRRYLEARGQDANALTLRAVVPVNLRPADQPVDWDRLGNYFGLVYLDLPVQRADPHRRLLDLRRSMERLKHSPEAHVARALLFVLGFVPTRLALYIDVLFARKGSVVVTNVPGPRHILSFAGQPVDEAVFFVPHPGRLAVGISIFSYAGAIRVGVRTDAAVVGDVRGLVCAFEREFEALCERGQLAELPR